MITRTIPRTKQRTGNEGLCWREDRHDPLEESSQFIHIAPPRSFASNFRSWRLGVGRNDHPHGAIHLSRANMCDRDGGAILVPKGLGFANAQNVFSCHQLEELVDGRLVDRFDPLFFLQPFDDSWQNTARANETIQLCAQGSVLAFKVCKPE